MIEQTDKVMRGPRRIGLLTLFQAPEPGGDLDFQDKRPRPWLDRFDREVDAVFFEHLNAIHEGGDGPERDAARPAQPETLAAIARALFPDALDRVSPPGARHDHARSLADTSLRAPLLRTTSPLDSSTGAAAVTSLPPQHPPPEGTHKK